MKCMADRNKVGMAKAGWASVSAVPSTAKEWRNRSSRNRAADRTKSVRQRPCHSQQFQDQDLFPFVISGFVIPAATVDHDARKVVPERWPENEKGMDRGRSIGEVPLSRQRPKQNKAGPRSLSGGDGGIQSAKSGPPLHGNGQVDHAPKTGTIPIR